MREKLNIFVEPKTQKPLHLKKEVVRDGHIITGELYNQHCKYPIIDGIPRFVEESYYLDARGGSGERTTAYSFGRKWREKRSCQLGYSSEDIRHLEEQLMAILGCSSVYQLKQIFQKSKRTLDAGCGVAWSEYLFNYHPQTEMHCMDIGLAVETAYKNTKRIDNVIVSQASVFELPYSDETFDIIYSVGVLHHTPNPKKALLCLSKKLKPSGLIGVYIYNKKPFLREMVDKEIRKITTMMDYEECMQFSKAMTALGQALNKVKQPLIIDKDIKLLGIKKGRYNMHSFIYNHFVKCWYNPKKDKKYADLVNLDWYHPFYASHHYKEEVESWFNAAGIKKIKYIRPKGWEYSGYFISGRKYN